MAILGAGFAGLVAAKILAQRGVPFVIFEGAPDVGGLAGTRRAGKELVHDIGAHFITNRLAHELHLSREMKRVKYYEEAVFVNRRWHGFPFGLLRIPGAAQSILERLAARRRTGIRSALDVIEDQYGSTVSSSVVRPLLERWSGEAASDLIPSAVDALPTSFLMTAMLHVFRKTTRLPVALGYSKEKPINPLVLFCYPASGGIATISNKLAEPIRDRIYVSTPVQSVIVDNGRIVAVRTSAGETSVRGVINTLPVNVLPRLEQGSNLFAPLAKLRFRRIVTTNLLLNSQTLLPAVVGWFPESTFPFFRITEVPLAAPWTVPDGKTVLTVDFGVDLDSHWWKDSDASVVERCIEAVELVYPSIKSVVTDASVVRIATGYPLFLKSYSDVLETLPETLTFPGFCSVGRNGEFAHLLMEDVYWRTQKKVQRFVADLVA